MMKESEPPKTYKYQEYLSQYENCPPDDYAELSMSAFRWIFEKGHENESDSFLPVLLITPERVNARQFDKDYMKCAGYALSLYNTLTNAKNAFHKISARLEMLNINFADNVGEFVAEITIETPDGVASDFTKKGRNKGHFNFHEYENVDFSQKIVEIQKL